MSEAKEAGRGGALTCQTTLTARPDPVASKYLIAGREKEECFIFHISRKVKC